MVVPNFPQSLILRVVCLILLLEVVSPSKLLWANTRLIFMDLRNICPYYHGIYAHRLLSKKEIHSILTIRENKKNREIHRYSRENA